MRAAELNRSGTIFCKGVQLLVYADDIDIISLNNQAVSSAFSKLDKEVKRMGLVVNEDKTNSRHIRISAPTSGRPPLRWKDPMEKGFA